nr:cationic amino acid transporter 2-like [Lepeophtheirus salmonis]
MKSMEEQASEEGYRIFRRKRIAPASIRPSGGLNRCLSTFDLTTLGIGATLGVGIYVLSGSVARDIAGPSIIFSFLLAGIASALSGLCYAELGSRVPLAGSAYVYSYVTVGELIGFIIGWNLILEYAIGTASVAKGYSGYLDSLFGGIFSSYLKMYFPINVPYLSTYPDLIALGITLLLTWLLACGVKESTRFNGIFTILNIIVVVFVIIAGLFKADTANWSIPKEKLPSPEFGDGGFFPYGISGTLAGAATCFYGFVGFDAIATSGEEARDPGRSIPLAIVLSLSLVFISYFGISSILTLVLPYYLQDSNAPLPHIFNYVGLHWIGKIVSFGALLGLSSSLLGAMFPLPRIIYAMATDGLIFRFLGDIHSKFRTPLKATFICGMLSGLMATLFELKNLVEMMSIGTLMAYTLVSVCVTVLRYLRIPNLDDDSVKGEYSLLCKDSQGEEEEEEEIISIGSIGQEPLVKVKADLFNRLFNMEGSVVANKDTSNMAIYGTGMYTFLTFILVLIHETLGRFVSYNVIMFINIITVIGILTSILIITRQPRCTDSNCKGGFRVPFVPLFPALSILCNLYLMSKLSAATWARFSIWMVIGFFIYIFYGINNSTEELRRRGRPIPSHF